MAEKYERGLCGYGDLLLLKKRDSSYSMTWPVLMRFQSIRKYGFSWALLGKQTGKLEENKNHFIFGSLEHTKFSSERYLGLHMEYQWKGERGIN